MEDHEAHDIECAWPKDWFMTLLRTRPVVSIDSRFTSGRTSRLGRWPVLFGLRHRVALDYGGRPLNKPPLGICPLFGTDASILDHLAHPGHLGFYRGRELFRRTADSFCPIA